MNNQTKGHLAALGASVIFGVNYSVVKYITPSVIKPLGLNVVRVLVTVVLFWSLLLFKKSLVNIKRKDWGLFIMCAACGIAINQMMFVKGLSLTTSIHASLLALATPVFITIIAAAFLKESLGINKVVGLVIAISGAALLILQKESTGLGSDILTGDFFIICNAISYAVFLVISRPLMRDYSPLWVLRIIFTIGTFMILPFGWKEFIEVEWAKVQPLQWTFLAFVAIGATFFAYLLNIYSLQHITSTTNGTYIYTQPVFAAIIAIVFLGEDLNIMKVISAVLIFAGVYLVNKKRAENTNSSELQEEPQTPAQG